MTTSEILSSVGGFAEEIVCLFIIAWMSLILFRIYLIAWRFVLEVFLSLRDLLKWTLLYFPVSCLLYIASRNIWAAVGSLFLILRIQPLVLFFAEKAGLHGLLFVDWEIYDMLWCSEYCAMIPTWVTPVSRLSLTSNISSLMKVWFERSSLML